jgi:hypothetical protein
MKSLLAGTILALSAVSAFAADMAIPTKAPSYIAAPTGFWVMGVEVGGAVVNHSFDFFNTGTGTLEVAGARAGGLFGYEWKNIVMFRLLGEAEYDFGKGGASCLGMGVACHFSHGGVITERVDFGLPQAWLGGATPFVSVGMSQSQISATVDNVGSAASWENAILAGAGLDVPMGPFSLGARWDHVWPAKTLNFGTTAGPMGVVVANTTASEVFKVNLKWRLP